ncbi:MAG: alpha/beta fold hydrolase [Sandaracinaceae bacterium]|nr:alpha/beta fold hydrolase [Sandaracinaceae bacterium]
MRKLALVGLALSFFACDRRAPAHTPAAPSTAEAPPVEHAPASPVERPSEPVVVPLPDPVEVELAASQGVVLHGSLYPASDPGAPAVILVHQLGSSRAEWATVIDALRESPTLTVLAIDLRGHGQSVRGAHGEDVSYGAFATDDWAHTSDDVRAFVAYLRSEGAPVHPSRIAVVGSSIGATAVVRAAVEDPSLDVIATLSPGRAYRGVDSILVALPIGPRAFFALASREELDSVETAEALARLTGGRVEIVDGHGHGVQILAESPDTLTTLATFLRESLAAPPAATRQPTADPTAVEPSGDPTTEPTP